MFQFIDNVIKEVKELWPTCKVVRGSPRHCESQGGVERVNQTVQKKLGNWMETNKSKKWSIGCKFVMWLYNTSYHNAVKSLPFVLVFGHQPKVGISNLPIDPNVLNTLATEADLNDIIQVENAPDDVASDERQSAGDLDCVDGGGQLSGSQGGSHGGGGGGSCGSNNQHSPLTAEEDNDNNDGSVTCSSITAEEDNVDNDGFLTVHFHDVKVHFHAAMSQRSMEVSNSLPLCHIFDTYRREEFIMTSTNLTFFLKNSGLVADDHCNGVYIDSDCQLCLLNLDIRGEIVFLVHGPQISQPNQLEESERIVGGPLKSQHTLASGGSTAAAASAKKRTWSVGDEFAAYASGNAHGDDVNQDDSTGSDGSISEYDIDREERRKFTEIYDKTRICRETLKLGDEIQYYEPIAIVGDPKRLCTGIVTCLTPDSDYIVQVNTGDPIHSNRPVKRVRERNSEGDLVAIKRKCRMRTSAEFRCLAGGSATAGITENVQQMTEVFRRTNNMLGMVGVSAVDLRQTPRSKSFLQYDSTNNDEDGGCANDDHVNDNVCIHRRRLREAATVNVQKQAAKVVKRLKDNGHANYKLDDVVQVLIPKQDRAKTDRHCLVGVVVEVQEKNSTCRIAVKGGVLDRCIAYQYLKQLPPNSNSVRLHDLETELESWRGLPTMSLRKASRMQSMVGGQGFSKCNCRGKCDNKRCSCRKKGLYCTARCHKGNGKCTNCDTDGNNDNSNNNDDDDDDVDNNNNNNNSNSNNSNTNSLSTTARTKTTATTDSEKIANFNIDNLNIDCYPSQLSFHATTISSNNNDNYCDQSILDLANQYVTAPSNNVEHNQNNVAMKAVANSNVTYLPPQAGKGQLPCPPIWIDKCTTKFAKALQLLKWRGMSKYQQELLCGIALAYEDREPAVSSL